MIQFTCPLGSQGRLVTDPEDTAGQDVVLDSAAFTVTVASGTGTFEYNSETNGLVFRRDPSGSDGDVTTYHVDVDGQPGKGESVLPLDIEMTAVPAPASPAVSTNESVALESDGTPA